MNKEPIKRLLDLAEKIIKVRGYDRRHARDEFDKFLFGFLAGLDTINLFERRSAGVTDEEWNEACEGFKKALNR
jgi:hypothetical protein